MREFRHKLPGAGRKKRGEITWQHINESQTNPVTYESKRANQGKQAEPSGRRNTKSEVQADIVGGHTWESIDLQTRLRLKQFAPVE